METESATGNGNSQQEGSGIESTGNSAVDAILTTADGVTVLTGALTRIDEFTEVALEGIGIAYIVALLNMAGTVSVTNTALNAIKDGGKQRIAQTGDRAVARIRNERDRALDKIWGRSNDVDRWKHDPTQWWNGPLP